MAGTSLVEKALESRVWTVADGILRKEASSRRVCPIFSLWIANHPGRIVQFPEPGGSSHLLRNIIGCAGMYSPRCHPIVRGNHGRSWVDAR